MRRVVECVGNDSDVDRNARCFHHLSPAPAKTWRDVNTPAQVVSAQMLQPQLLMLPTSGERDRERELTFQGDVTSSIT